MPIDSSFPMLSNTQARELAGRVVTIGGVTYSFQSYDPDHPGQPPWRSGERARRIRSWARTVRWRPT